MIRSDDFVQTFIFEGAGVRGVIVRLRSSWQEVCAHADYPESVRELLGQTLVSSALFIATLKLEGSLSIQLRADDPLRLLFAECDSDGQLRGLARWMLAPGERASLPADGTLAVTIDNAVTQTRYQGLVPLEGADLAQGFEQYFQRSEQLPTRLVLATGTHACAGIMLQRIAGGGGHGPDDADADADAWDRVRHLLGTVSSAELLELPAPELLRRLFHQEDVRLFDARALKFHCSCTRARVAQMLQSLGRAEAEETLAENEGEVSVTCEFCNQHYSFDAVDIAALFAAPTFTPGPDTTQ